jgi:hypothetical protein
MSVELVESFDGKVVTVRASDKLTREDYAHFVPAFERLIAQHGKIRVLFDLHDFHGWKTGALWEDMKFGVKHFRDVERLAIIGEKTWEKWMATFCRPFTTANIRYFDQSEAEAGRQRIEEGMTVATA